MLPKLFGLYASLGLLMIVVHGDLQTELQTMAENGELIHGIFRLGRCIGAGGFSLIYEGESIIQNRPVAMKFIDRMYTDLANREYAIYTYLNAISNPDVERYGIPSIYYFNTYGDSYHLMVFSLFEIDLHTKSENYEIQTIDNLILFRDFVRQSKYMHSKGIRHNDIKPENIMIRKHRSFLIDFNLSSKLNQPSHDGTFNFLPRSAYDKNQQRTALDDWESFLYTMSEVNKIDLQWFDGEQYLRVRGNESRQMCGDMKKNTKETLKRIKAKKTCQHLQDIFVAFAMEALKKVRSLPDYDRFDALITDKIAIITRHNQLALFSWLSQPERNVAAIDLHNNQLVRAIDIQFNRFEYPTVEYDYFAVQIDEMAAGWAPNRENYLRKKAELGKLRSRRSKKCVPKCLSKYF